MKKLDAILTNKWVSLFICIVAMFGSWFLGFDCIKVLDPYMSSGCGFTEEIGVGMATVLLPFCVVVIICSCSYLVVLICKFIFKSDSSAPADEDK